VLIFNLWEENTVYNKFASVFSQLFHYASFRYLKPVTQTSKARFIISIDVDVGGENLGEINSGKNDLNVHNSLPERFIGRIEEQAIPFFLELVDKFEIPVTFCLRGQLAELDNSIINNILSSSVEHEIGAHGYSHRTFTNLSNVEAYNELRMISTGLKDFGIKPKSFVFPKNRIAHLPLLEKWDYICFRGYGDFLRDGMYLRRHGNLCDVHPGLFLGQCHNDIILKKIVDVAVWNNAPLHVWFHLWDFGLSQKIIRKKLNKVVLPLFEYIKVKQQNDLLKLETMSSVAKEQLAIWKNACVNKKEVF